MKCAKEIIEIAEVAIYERERERRIEEEKRQRKMMEAKTNAIRYCEEIISNELEEAAKNCETSITIRLGEYQYGANKFATRLYPTKTQYKGSTLSLRADEDYLISLSALKDYLNQHCYKVTIRESLCAYYRYGFGSQLGYEVEITCDPQC